MVLATFILVIDDDKKIELKKIPYIYHLIWVRQDKIWALLNSKSKINAISLDYA